jgi:hypothetical protein
VFGRHKAQSQLPFGAHDAVVKQGPSRHRGLDVTVVAPKRGPRFRAYVHTPDWQRALAVSTAASAEAAASRAEAVLAQAIDEGVRVHLADRAPSTPAVVAHTAPANRF